MPSRSTIERELVAIREQIRRHGWALACGPGGQYSVGLTRYEGHPELLVNGACHEHGWDFVSTLAHEVAQGRRFEAGQIVEVDGVPMTFIVVEAPQRWILLADRLYRVAGGAPVPALQAVIRNEYGWPWDPTRDGDLLGPPPAWAA